MDIESVKDTAQSVIKHVDNIEDALGSSSKPRDIYIRNQLAHIQSEVQELFDHFDPHSPIHNTEE